MRTLGLILTLAVLAACEPTSAPRQEPKPEPSESGVSVSGYARVGVSTGS